MYQAQKVFSIENAFCLSTKVKSLDFFSIKFKKLLATDNEVQLTFSFIFQENQIIQLS
ncbi:MAG: hypothetical protein LBQ24_07175 [Candidatus Peribacteria bacterium]|nr:hypothetical protein [Candidatus Peribacteria bacterium]